jgi:hypothetical protein
MVLSRFPRLGFVEVLKRMSRARMRLSGWRRVPGSKLSVDCLLLETDGKALKSDQKFVEAVQIVLLHSTHHKTTSSNISSF